MSYIEKLLIGRRRDSDHQAKGSVHFRRQMLLDEIYDHFIMRFEDETTDESMLFPSSFCIFLNSDYYNANNQTFAATVKDVVNKCNKYIRNKKEKYEDYKPHSQYWRFQFVPLQSGCIVDNNAQAINNLEPDRVVITSTIYPTNNRHHDDEQQGDRVVFTMHTKKNNFKQEYNWAINMNALGDVNMLSRDCFTVPFGNFEKVTSTPLSENGSNTNKASLRLIGASFIIDNQEHSSYIICHDDLIISGMEGGNIYGGITVLHINSKDIVTNHIQIKRNKESNEYQIKFRSKVRYNDCLYNANENSWLRLYDNSHIVIGECDLIFTTK